MSATSWMIYGATGYTGALIARKAVAQGLRPTLAGRGRNVQQLAAELDLPSRVFDLGDAATVRAGLADMQLVLHCAGPFSATAAPMIQGCLEARAHYLDITGEIPVFEYAASCDAAARERGIVVCPGVGFDVVPTDCLAAALRAALPDATQLTLGFDSDSPLSPGTAKTLVEGMAHGGKVRRAGRIVDVAFAHRVREIDFGRGLRTALTIPWGDVSTAFHSTGIPDIECYISCPPKAARWMPRLRWTRPLLGLAPMQRWLKSLIERKVHGPTERQLKTLSTWVWGEVRNARGEVRVGRVQTANGYALTVDSALTIATALLAQAPRTTGFATPSRLFGPQLVEQLPGSHPIRITQGDKS